MVIFLLVGVFSSFVAIAMVIAMLKCCVESLANGADDRQKLENLNAYRGRYANPNKQNTCDTDDLTQVWTANENNATDTQWTSSNIEDGGNEGDIRLEDGCDSTTGVRNDSKQEIDNPKSDGDESTLRGENRETSETGVESKFVVSGHDATFGGGSNSVTDRSDHHDSTFGGGSHSAFGGHDSSFGRGHDSSFGRGHETGYGGGNDTGFGTGSSAGYGDDSYGGASDYGGGGGGRD